MVNSGSDPEGKGPIIFTENNHDGTFTDVARRVGVDVSVVSRGRGAAWGDYDNDGFLDLFVTNGEDNTLFIEGPQFLYHNEGNRNNWLKIKLVGTTSNRQGLGAKVTIQIGQSDSIPGSEWSRRAFSLAGGRTASFWLGSGYSG